MPKKRPFGVTLLLWLVLSLSAWGALRLVAAQRFGPALSEFGARLSRLYFSITGAGWIAVGGLLLWGLFSGKRWIRWAFPAVSFLWVAGYWIERLFFESPRENSLFALIASILLLVVTLISALNRKTRQFFFKSEEYEQPNEYTESP